MQEYLFLVSEHEFQILDALRVCRSSLILRLSPAERFLYERCLAFLNLEDAAFDRVFDLCITDDNSKQDMDEHMGHHAKRPV